MKLKTTLLAVCTALSLSINSASSAINIGTVVTDVAGLGTLTLDNDIVFTAIAGFTIVDTSFVGISAGYAGSIGSGNSGIGDSLTFGGGAAGSKPYTGGGVGLTFGGLTADMATMTFSGGDNPAMSIGDTVTIAAGVYGVNNSAGTGGKNLNLTLTDASIVFTVADAPYPVTAVVVPEPSTFAALAGLGALGLVVYRRRK